ncbi:Hypothetical_protein [Hexamita inflata]|uniref:Hypothetical_protein n=1 Tax=Hexamita inflata TaxID=28002 RepID=A0AA86QKE3_9EUKA|nr:Hypothetical protein HINF_LOCUS47930 [Hexamita inflata]
MKLYLSVFQLCALSLQTTLTRFSYYDDVATPLTVQIPSIPFRRPYISGYFSNFEFSKYMQDIQPVSNISVFSFNFILEGRLRVKVSKVTVPARFICSGKVKTELKILKELKANTQMECNFFGNGFMSDAMLKIFSNQLSSELQDEFQLELKHRLQKTNLLEQPWYEWTGSGWDIIFSSEKCKFAGEFAKLFPNRKSGTYFTHEEVKTICAIKDEHLDKKDIMACFKTRNLDIEEVEDGIIAA